jgi:Uma2 family endonuclease
MRTKTRAAVTDLYQVPDNAKAELVNGEVVAMSPTGIDPTYAAGEVFASLRECSRETRSGRAVTDNAGFVVNLPHRQSFSPDAAFYPGNPRGQKFFPTAPAFAAEVRSEGDYGPAAEREMAAKRADYFAAGTLVVWDVDLLSPDIVKVYRADSPDTPTIYRSGDQAEAEPAVPGWSMPVDDLFPPDW